MRLPRKLVGKERRPWNCLHALRYPLFEKLTMWWCAHRKWLTWHDCRSCTEGRARQ